MITSAKHVEAITRLAIEYIKSVLPANVTLMGVTIDGITIESSADTLDIELTNTLNNLASWWGYRHGECQVTITARDGNEFFDAAKLATIVFC